MIKRILSWHMRDAVYDHGDTDMASGALTWKRHRNGWISGPYQINTIRDGGVMAYHEGTFLNGGLMLEDVEAARSYCEQHHAENSPHGYDWQAMDFDPTAEILGGFFWDKTPEGHAWWARNEDTIEGWDRHAEMKRLYAADHRHNDEAMKQSARNMIPTDLED